MTALRCSLFSAELVLCIRIFLRISSALLYAANEVEERVEESAAATGMLDGNLQSLPAVRLPRLFRKIYGLTPWQESRGE